MENDSKKKLKNKRRRQRHQNARKKLSVAKPETTTESIPETVTAISIPTDVKIDQLPIEMKTVTKPADVEPTKTREEILAERKAKKLEKMAKKPSTDAKTATKPTVPAAKQAGIPAKTFSVQPNSSKPASIVKVAPVNPTTVPEVEKTREEIMAERTAKKQAKLQQKGKPNTVVPVTAAAKKSIDEPDRSIAKAVENLEKTVTAALPEKMSALKIDGDSDVKTKAATSKAERRAIQEAQRAAKAQAMLEHSNKSKGVDVKQLQAKVNVSLTVSKTEGQTKKIVPQRRIASKPTLHRVKLFDHLYLEKMSFNMPINKIEIHKEVTKLGIQYANNIIVGSNARCIAFLKAMKMVIDDYETSEQKDFCRELDNIIQPCVDYLEKCRPFSVSMKNALANIKMHKTQLKADDSDAEKKEYLLETIDTYIRDQIEKAAQAISISVQDKISNGDVILTYGCSSLIQRILREASCKNDSFRVIVVDSRPTHEGQAMIKRLVKNGIECKTVLISALGFIMPEVTKVILGAHALLANGCVMGRVGTAQIALVAKSYNVPVLVCCETHKFSERVQTDAFVHNEISNPDDIMLSSYDPSDSAMTDWRSIAHLTPLNIRYDITPPEFVTAVITEIAILPCTSVPVILRIKPSEIGY